ncbi:MAG: hypothetical protein WDA21_02100 [Bacilli bacterium]
MINLNYNIKLLCTVNEKSTNIKHYLQNINKNVKILIVVGPECGFIIEEETLFYNECYKI